jgi:hypothetical protein
VLRKTELIPQARFHHALAVLLDGEVGMVEPAATTIRDVLTKGFRPPGERVTEALASLATLESPQFPELAALVADLAPEAVAPVVPDLLARAAAGTPPAVAAASEVAAARALNAAARLDLYVASAEGSLILGEGEAFDRALDGIEDLLAEAALDDLDRLWADRLDQHQRIREHIGAAEADFTRARLYAGIGEHERSIAVLESILYRVLNGQYRGYDACEIVEQMAAWGAEKDVIERLSGLVLTEEMPTLSDRSTPVTVLFIGGDDRQAQHDQPVEEALREAAGGRVRVEWLHSGWDSNWGKWADQAERLYSQVDIAVLHPFMRTNLGRYLRRTLGEAGIQWRSCTGHGRHAIERAILQAAAVVDTTPKRSPEGP